jgi:hypothetical protein
MALTLDEIFTDITNDFKIDPTNLGGEALRTSTGLFPKYIKEYSQCKLRVELLENQKKNILASRRRYYSGDATPEEYQKNPFNLKIKNESVMKQYLENDPDIVKADEKILIEQQKVEIFYGCLEEIKRRGYSIKVAVDMTKFEAGI